MVFIAPKKSDWGRLQMVSGDYEAKADCQVTGRTVTCDGELHGLREAPVPMQLVLDITSR